MEWILLLIVAVLLLFGAKKIPEFARSLGKAKAEFQRGQRMVEREIYEEQAREERMERKKKMRKRTSDIEKAALALGIETEGKTTAQLKKEIAEKVG